MLRISKPILFAIAVMMLVGTAGGYAYFSGNRPPILEIYVFALSSGRSMFIRTPADQRILIDGGGNSDVIRSLSGVLPFYTRRIDVVLATNTEGKNESGLIDVLNRYDIGKVYVPSVTLESLGLASATDETYKTFIDSVHAKNVPIISLKTGDIIALDSKINFAVFFPEIAGNFAYSKASVPEVLFRISFGNNSAIFLGSASKKVQKYLATSSLSTLSTDVLVVSHSALLANMSTELMDEMNPRYLVYSKALTSRGKGTIDETLAGIPDNQRFNLRQSGTIRIISDGKDIEIKKAH